MKCIINVLRNWNENGKDGLQTMKEIMIPIWERYALTVNEAAEYYHIGESKLRRIAEENPDADFIIMNGNRVLFKRQKFDNFLDKATAV